MLADNSKFNRESFVNIVSITDMDAIVTDKQFKEQYLKLLEENNVNVVMV